MGISEIVYWTCWWFVTADSSIADFYGGIRAKYRQICQEGSVQSLSSKIRIAASSQFITENAHTYVPGLLQHTRILQYRNNSCS